VERSLEPGFFMTTPQSTIAPLLEPFAPARPTRAHPLDRLATLVELILAENTRQNLTADKTPDLFWPRHIEDAVRAAAALHARVAALAAPRILDIGAGGGIPGLVWSLLWPSAKVVLLDSRRKRTAFLERAARELNLPCVDVLTGRAEELAHDARHREAYDLATARAVAPLPVLLELALPFAAVGGAFAAIKSADQTMELAAAAGVPERLGARAAGELDYRRSDGKACRVLIYQKRGPTPSRFPRNGAQLARRPLGPAMDSA